MCKICENSYIKSPTPPIYDTCFTHRLSIGEALNGDIRMSLKERKICFLHLFYDRTVLFGYDSWYIKSVDSISCRNAKSPLSFDDMVSLRIVDRIYVKKENPFVEILLCNVHHLNSEDCDTCQSLLPQPSVGQFEMMNWAG